MTPVVPRRAGVRPRGPWPRARWRRGPRRVWWRGFLPLEGASTSRFLRRQCAPKPATPLPPRRLLPAGPRARVRGGKKIGPCRGGHRAISGEWRPTLLRRRAPSHRQKLQRRILAPPARRPTGPRRTAVRPWTLRLLRRRRTTRAGRPPASRTRLEPTRAFAAAAEAAAATAPRRGRTGTARAAAGGAPACRTSAAARRPRRR
mmetsp:Transcript_20112/g.68117  ORF Transcript_20112/g.68117 Transcript_20112/m.68117 type:complete len:203 (+) Transcript_20112:511-1119(+)